MDKAKDKTEGIKQGDKVKGSNRWIKQRDKTGG